MNAIIHYGGNMRLNEAIGERTKQLLNERGLSNYYLFKKGGIPRSTISAVVNVKKKNVSTNTVYQISATLDLSLKEFFDSPIFDAVDD